MVLITILDNITQTSMPFNEFVLYRFKHYTSEKQFIIVCGKEEDNRLIDVPHGLQVMFVGKKIKNIKKAIKSIISWCKNAGFDYVIHLHQVKSAFLAELAMIGTGFRKKVIFTVHSTFSGYKFHNKVLSFLNCLLANRVVCVSNASFNDYPSLIKRIKKDKISAIQNGVDTDRIDNVFLQPVTNDKHETIDCVYVARIIPIKNHSFLIDVIKKLDNKVRFIFIGAEDKKCGIRELVKKEKLENRVLFKGLLPREEVFKELSKCDLYISSSTLEGLPVSVLEAMYCSLPCVLSNIPQHLEIGSADGSVSFIGFDADLWAEKINSFANLPSEEKIEMRKRIKEYVFNKYSLKLMHRKYDCIYEEISHL